MCADAIRERLAVLSDRNKGKPGLYVYCTTPSLLTAFPIDFYFALIDLISTQKLIWAWNPTRTLFNDE